MINAEKGEKIVTVERKEVSMTASQFMSSFLLRCKKPDGNYVLTVKRGAKNDRDAIALAEGFGVGEFVIPTDIPTDKK